MILGLTGGMGGGKTTVARLFENEGYLRIDSDAIVRGELLTAPEVVAEIGRRFPDAVEVDASSVKRDVLAKHVFASDDALAWLECLLHPRLYARWREKLDASPAASWIVEAPLLFEKGLENWFDFVVCVATTPRRQIARLEERGVPRPLAEQRISRQLPLEQKIERAHFVISNDGSPEALRLQVARLARSLAAAG